MASTMIHLTLAHKINPDGCGLYYIGSYAPDNFDSKRSDVREAKTKNHFRDAPDMEAALREFHAKIDISNPFHVGYFGHLLFDMWWEEIIEQFREYCENQQDWFSRLRGEYRITGMWIRRNMPWVRDVFCKMESVTNFDSPMPDPSNAEILTYKNMLTNPENLIQAMGKEVEPSNFFTPEFLESCSAEYFERYRAWIKE